MIDDKFLKIQNIEICQPVRIGSIDVRGTQVSIIEHVDMMDTRLIPSIEVLNAIINSAINTITYLKQEQGGDEWHLNMQRIKDCKERIATLRKASAKKKSQTRIYLMRHGRTGLVKIGRSKSPLEREATLQAEDPMVSLIFASKLVDVGIEKTLHRKFSNVRVRGEWFNLTKEDIDFIINKIESTC